MVGALALVMGNIAHRAWPYLAALSLRLSAQLVRLTGHQAFVEQSRATIQVGNFLAEIAEPCSGIEGIGLMSILVGTYLFAFRRELRWPRAFVLLPLGVVLDRDRGASFLAILVAGSGMFGVFLYAQAQAYGAVLVDLEIVERDV